MAPEDAQGIPAGETLPSPPETFLNNTEEIELKTENDIPASQSTTHLLSEEYLKLHDAHNRLHESYNLTNVRLNELEKRVAAKSIATSSSGSDTNSDAGSDFSDVEDDYALGYEENTIPEARDLNFEQFKNRFSERDGKSCIEVLVAGSNFEEQVRQELKRRGELDQDDYKPRVNYDESDERIIHRVRIQSPAILWLLHEVLESTSITWKGQNRTTFYRPFAWFVHAHDGMVKKLEELEKVFSEGEISDEVKSQTIAEAVAHLLQPTKDDKKGEPPTPSKPSISEETTNEVKDEVTEEAGAHTHKSLAKRIERDALEKAFMGSYHTLLELRCYVEFVNKRILPQFRRYDDPKKDEARNIRYQDLWYLFRTGDLLYNLTPTKEGGVEVPQITRIYGKDKPDATSTFLPGLTAGDSYVVCRPRRPRNDIWHRFRIWCYSLDFNGDSYGSTAFWVEIPYFEGLNEVTSLPAYPLRFHADPEKLKELPRANGERFRDATRLQHMVHRGWSLPWTEPQAPRPGIPGVAPPPPGYKPGGPPRTGPSHGGPPPIRPAADTEPGRPLIMLQSTFIESDIVVDVKEAYRAFPPWRRELRNAMESVPRMHACQDSIEIIRWSDKQRTTKISTVQDRTQAEDGIPAIVENKAVKTDPFLKTQKDPTFSDEDLLLLPKRIFAYALRERKFFQADVQCLRTVQIESDAFDNLKIDPSHVRTVNAVVSSHFERKEIESLTEFSTLMDLDLIRGKGRGLVILLHGAPGVGKTATAEAVALAHQKPLFIITCGDLGFTPQGVESSLGEIFRLAHLWNCILLLDEADVFLSQRETNALERNALVSVFLRVLEYYNGILFLTTNRVGTLDEAFKSRVHLSLYYPSLGRTQTEEITRMNLIRLKKIETMKAKAVGKEPPIIYEDKICKFAVEHWDRHGVNDGQGRWNGRQIRNAVQIAASLAWYDRKIDKTPGTEKLPPILDDTHFAIVEKTMSLFEGYMTKTKGGTDTFMSHQRAERYDKFQNPQHVIYADQASSSGPGGGGYYQYPNRQRTPQPQPGWQQQQMTPQNRPQEQFHGMQASHSASPSHMQHQTPQHMMHSNTTYMQTPGHYPSGSSSNTSMHMTDPNTPMASGMSASSMSGQSQYSHFSPQSSYVVSGASPGQFHGSGYQQAEGSGQSSSQRPSQDPFAPRADVRPLGSFSGQETTGAELS